jgi:hypothetical protein
MHAELIRQYWTINVERNWKGGKAFYHLVTREEAQDRWFSAASGIQVRRDRVNQIVSQPAGIDQGNEALKEATLPADHTIGLTSPIIRMTIGIESFFRFNAEYRFRRALKGEKGNNRSSEYRTQACRSSISIGGARIQTDHQF